MTWFRTIFKVIEHLDFQNILLEGWQKKIHKIQVQNSKCGKVLENTPIQNPKYPHKSKGGVEHIIIFLRKKEDK